MSMMKPGVQSSYSARELTSALRAAGLEQGDTVFLHVCLENLGELENARTAEDGARTLWASIQEVLGESGTTLVPTYTFSFCRQELFDVQNTPTPGGPWSTSKDFLEFFRRLPGTFRSRDPIHSVAGRGPRAEALLKDVPPTCFGPGSVHERLLEVGGKICLIGVGLGEASFRHHVEEVVGFPGRFKKLFTGQIRDRGVTRKQGWVYNVPILADNCVPDGSRLDQLARRDGTAKVVPVGQGEILATDCRGYFARTREQLRRDPWFTLRGPGCDTVAAEDARVHEAAPPPPIVLAPTASMEQIIDRLWSLPRNLISDGFDTALSALTGILPAQVHEFPSGTECWTWIIPEKWSCREAYLETLDGRRVFSYADNPLHVVSYSLPFEGVVTREVLDRHLHTHPKAAEAIPYIFKYYERDWGLCCSKNLKDSLQEEKYRVVIRTDFRYSTLKVAEIVAPGDSEECFVIASHLCHPAMVNDDMAGVAVGMDVMRHVLRRKTRRYTYRYLIVPETIGSVAWLSRHEHLIPKIKGGLFLEMLGLDNPHALQMSLNGDTEVDRVFRLVLKAADPFGWTGAFRTIIGNDERQFNGQGVGVPMLSLSRVLPPSSPNWPYREYHSSLDNPSLCSPKRLAESRDLVLAMVDALEENRVPQSLFKGEAFCSRYGLFVDGYANPEGNRALFDILFLIDGKHSVAQIAESCGISFASARSTIEEFVRNGLVRWS